MAASFRSFTTPPIHDAYCFVVPGRLCAAFCPCFLAGPGAAAAAACRGPPYARPCALDIQPSRQDGYRTRRRLRAEYRVAGAVRRAIWPGSGPVLRRPGRYARRSKARSGGGFRFDSRACGGGGGGGATRRPRHGGKTAGVRYRGRPADARPGRAARHSCAHQLRDHLVPVHVRGAGSHCRQRAGGHSEDGHSGRTSGAKGDRGQRGISGMANRSGV